ncbi:VOC family protein [Mucilaginibacter ginkgonis]|uniref:VOC family protein n=1 Tax=Mucilaginibacter ginkgonis TaxID=2682091 RepID=A0A6I4HWG8_9SPHI|nr:VOC family protein [Mucilaginibacter ginkgonis]QQL51051.1 VOC family protein [Mucilaginibacter ginkgonis]
MTKTHFSPMLVIKSGVTDLDFYKRALGAEELRLILNDDGTIHVGEFSINGAMFHFHEAGKGTADPVSAGAITTIIGLFVDDVDAYTERAIKAGGRLVSPVQSYDYGYRQSQFTDPHGHRWQLQQKYKSVKPPQHLLWQQDNVRHLKQPYNLCLQQ